MSTGEGAPPTPSLPAAPAIPPWAVAAAFGALLATGLGYRELRISQILSGDADPDATCAGSWWVDQARERAEARVAIPVISRDGTRLERIADVPEFVLNACLRAELPRGRAEAQAAFGEHLEDARRDARVLLQDGMGAYLDERFSAISNVLVDLEDAAMTAMAGACGCASGCSRSGPMGALEGGLDASWRELGSTREAWLRDLLNTLLAHPEARLEDALKSWFNPRGEHEAIMAAAVDRALGRAVGAEVRAQLPDDASVGLLSAPGLAISSPDGMPEALRQVLQVGLEASTSHAGEMIKVAGVRSTMSGRLVRFGGRAGHAALSSLVTSALLVKIEELFYRDQIASEISAAFQEQGGVWQTRCLDDYDQALAELEAPTQEALLTEARRTRLVAWRR